MWVLVFKYFFKPHAISAKQCKKCSVLCFPLGLRQRPTGGRVPRWRPSELGTPDTATWSDLQDTRVFLSLLRAIWGKWSPAESWGLGVLHRFSKVREREGLRSQVGRLEETSQFPETGDTIGLHMEGKKQAFLRLLQLLVLLWLKGLQKLCSCLPLPMAHTKRNSISGESTLPGPDTAQTTISHTAYILKDSSWPRAIPLVWSLQKKIKIIYLLSPGTWETAQS